MVSNIAYPCDMQNCGLHLFEICFFWISLLHLRCRVFNLIDDWIWIITFSSKVVLFSCPWKRVTSFKIKKQNFFNISLIIKGFIFLINVLCPTFDVFRGGWVEKKSQNDVLRGNVSMDASPKKLLKIHTFNSFVLNASFLYLLKTLENLKVFWCFQRVEKGCIENKWVSCNTFIRKFLNYSVDKGF